MSTPGRARLAEVSCNTHGPMHYRFALDWWVCAGFDGEGCTVQIVYSEDVHAARRDPSGIPGVTVRYEGAP